MKTKTFKPTLEILESREVPTAVSAWMNGNVLNIVGTHLPDRVTVTQTGAGWIDVGGVNSRSSNT